MSMKYSPLIRPNLIIRSVIFTPSANLDLKMNENNAFFHIHLKYLPQI